MNRSRRIKDSKPESDNNQQETMYYQASRKFSYLQPDARHSIAKDLEKQITRPGTSNNLKRDYSDLKDLMNCTNQLFHSKNRSLKSLSKMKQINHNSRLKQNMYQPLNAQLQKSVYVIDRQKYNKNSNKTFNKYFNERSKMKMQTLPTNRNSLASNNSQQNKLIPNSANLSMKMAIFGTISEEQKQQIVLEIKQSLRKSNNSSLNAKLYQINYLLLERLMRNMCMDTSNIALRNNHYKQYHMIKSEMVDELIGEDRFQQIVDLLTKQHNQHTSKSINSSKHMISPKNESKLTRKTAPKNRAKPKTIIYNSSDKSKQNDLLKQFEQTYNITAIRICKAKQDLVTRRRINNYVDCHQTKL